MSYCDTIYRLTSHFMERTYAYVEKEQLQK